MAPSAGPLREHRRPARPHPQARPPMIDLSPQVRAAALKAVARFPLGATQADVEADQHERARQQIRVALDALAAAALHAPHGTPQRQTIDVEIARLVALQQHIRPGFALPAGLADSIGARVASAQTVAAAVTAGPGSVSFRLAMAAANSATPRFAAEPGRGALEAGYFSGAERGSIHAALVASSPAYAAHARRVETYLRAEQPETDRRKKDIFGLAQELGVDHDESDRKARQLQDALDKAIASGNILDAARLNAELKTELLHQATKNLNVAEERGNEPQKVRARATEDAAERDQQKAIREYEGLAKHGAAELRKQGQHDLGDALDKDTDAVTGRMQSTPGATVEQIKRASNRRRYEQQAAASPFAEFEVASSTSAKAYRTLAASDTAAEPAAQNNVDLTRLVVDEGAKTVAAAAPSTPIVVAAASSPAEPAASPDLAALAAPAKKAAAAKPADPAPAAKPEEPKKLETAEASPADTPDAPRTPDLAALKKKQAAKQASV